MRSLKHIFLKLCSLGAFLLLAMWFAQSANINKEDANTHSPTPTTTLSYFESVSDIQEPDDVNLEAVIVCRVVDGDTLIVQNMNGEKIRVRLIGIDSPESVNPDESKNTEAGIIASDYTKNRLPEGTTVYLQYDKERTDQYDRTLAYVWLHSDVDIHNTDDVKLYMYNAELIMSGNALAKEYPPNVLYSEIFFEIQQEYQ